jgi:hypothetical protein
MSPVSRLLYRLGYVKLREYGYILTSDGRIVAASAPPDQLLETTDWRLPPDLGVRHSPSAAAAIPAAAIPAAAVHPRAAAPPPSFAFEPTAVAEAPVAEVIALDTGALEAVDPEVANDDEVDDDEEWEWRMAMARAQERAEAPTAVVAAPVAPIARPAARPATTPPREVAAAFTERMPAPANEPEPADDADEDAIWEAARARAVAQEEVTRSTVIRAAPTRPAERPLPRVTSRLTRQSVLPPREKRPEPVRFEPRAARGTGAEYVRLEPTRSAFDDDTSVETQLEPKPFAQSR